MLSSLPDGLFHSMLSMFDVCDLVRVRSACREQRAIVSKEDLAQSAAAAAEKYARSLLLPSGAYRLHTRYGKHSVEFNPDGEHAPLRYDLSVDGQPLIAMVVAACHRRTGQVMDRDIRIAVLWARNALVSKGEVFVSEIRRDRSAVESVQITFSDEGSDYFIDFAPEN